MAAKASRRGASSLQSDEEEWQGDRPYRRFFVVAAVLVGFTAFILIQLVRWQVVERNHLVSIAQAQVLPLERAPVTTRGEIMDRWRHLLAIDIFEYSLWASPEEVWKNNDVGKISTQLAAVLGMARDEIAEPLLSDRPYVLLANRVPHEIWRSIDSSESLNMLGFNWEIEPKRMYPEGPLGAHVLGFVNAGHEGYFGVEGFYDQQLVSTASHRRSSAEDDTTSALYQPLEIQTGHKLVLTIDRTIEYAIEKELIRALKTYKAESGTIIVMAPRSGAILAMASYPTFDANHFMDTPQERFANPAISKQHEPGSVFKVVTIAAGIDSGAITPRTMFNDTGDLEVGGRRIFNWDRGRHGMVDMTEVLGKSLNTGAAHVSMMLGKNRFYTYIRRFGFGSLTDVDMAGEISGRVKLPGDSEWHESDLGTNAFGQGIAVTPLQMLNAVAAVANRGQLMRPHVVGQIIDGEQVVDVESAVVRRAISSSTAEQVTAMMVQAVEREIPEAQVPGHTVAGKTGTAEIPTLGGYKSNETIASFVGYAPAYDPKFVVLVKIDRPHTSPWGSQVAAPVFRRIAQFLFNHMDIPPDRVALVRR